MKLIIVLSVVLISGCAATQSSTRVDEVIMYGGIDRSSIPELKSGDEEFISKVIDGYGSKDKAARAFIDQGFNFYNQNDYGMATRRFNQAWLLDPTNPEVYHGFASITYDKGDNCGAMEYFDMAMAYDTSRLKQNEIGFLADNGMVTSLCALQKQGDTKSNLLKKSNSLFLSAERIGKTQYLYDKWGQALYWQEEYSKAWEKVFKVRSLGGEVLPAFLKELKSKMEEPKK